MTDSVHAGDAAGVEEELFAAEEALAVAGALGAEMDRRRLERDRDRAGARARVRVVVRPLDVDALRARLEEFELRFGLPSDRLVEAFRRDGALVETAEFHDWSFTYATYLLATGRDALANG